MSKFYNLSDDAISRFEEVFNKKAFPLNVGFQYVGSESQKELIKITKVSDVYNFLLEKELLVSINEDLMDKFDDESVTILIEQELDKISINIDSGKIKFIKPDLSTFASLVSKYGIEKISRANQVEELYNQQKMDSEEGFIS
jgi:hypothetical protein